MPCGILIARCYLFQATTIITHHISKERWHKMRVIELWTTFEQIEIHTQINKAREFQYLSMTLKSVWCWQDDRGRNFLLSVYLSVFVFILTFSLHAIWQHWVRKLTYNSSFLWQYWMLQMCLWIFHGIAVHIIKVSRDNILLFLLSFCEIWEEVTSYNLNNYKFIIKL